ncbi:MAG: PAS domain S-box protein [bacterium]
MDKYKLIFQNSLDAQMIVDGESGRILQANCAVKIILGYEPKDLIGKEFTVLIPPMSESSLKTAIEEMKIFGAVFVQKLLRADGSSDYVDMTLTMIQWGRSNAILVTLRDITERMQAEEEREKLIQELQEASVKIKTLRGLLPICASCKKIRDDKGYWQQLEAYIQSHSEAEFSHGICPDCVKKPYPEFYRENEIN